MAQVRCGVAATIARRRRPFSHRRSTDCFVISVIVEVEIGVLLVEFGAAVCNERNLSRSSSIARALVLRRGVREDQAIDLRVFDEIAAPTPTDRRRRCAGKTTRL